MTDQEILVDMLRHFSDWTHWALEETPLDALSWRPDAEANNIAVTVWHFSRALDVLRARVLEDKPREAEQWYVGGWAQKTAYDPRGKGAGGLGNLAGYTQEQVAEVPILPADDLLRYFDRAVEALCEYVAGMSLEELYRDAPGWPWENPQTAYVCIRNFLMDSMGHLGEVRAIKAMWERKTRAD